MKKMISLLLCVLLAVTAACGATAENTEAPRAYFPYPAELENLPDNFSLPDLFEFFDASADPDGSGRVESPAEWEARRAELKDMMEYYLYGSRLDPRPEDTVVTAVRKNYEYIWADGIMQGPPSMFGYNAPPLLPEGAVSMMVMDFSAWGMGMVYGSIAPDDSFVYSGDGYDMAGDLTDWKNGDTWAEHTDAVTRMVLPTVTVDVLIYDRNPDHAEWVSEDAKTNGVPFSFNIRYPSEPPTVDGTVRNPESSRNGAGYPVVVMGGLSEAQQVTLTNNGYAYVSANDSADPDSGQLSVYERVYPPQDPVVHNDNTIVNDYMVDSGDFMHSGWVCSRAMDALENYKKLSDGEKAALCEDVIIPDIDTFSSAMIGCSNGAKRAIVGAVFDTGDNGDTRFDIIAASDPGGGGASGFRYSTEGQLFSYQPPVQNGMGGVVVHDFAYGLNETTQRAVQNSGEDQWFGDRAQILTVRPDLADNMPFDAHALYAAYATANEERYILTWTGEGQDAWLNSPATVLNTWGAREAFEFLGQGDNIAVIVRDQAHANQDRDLADLIALMDHVYYKTEGPLNRKYHATLAGPDGLSAADGSGTITPDQTFESLREMERNPYYIPSTNLKWSRPGKHFLWTESNSVTEGVPMTFEFHTDGEQVELLLTDGETVLKADVQDGIASIPLSADQAKAGQYKATAVGEKDPKSIEISGWTIRDALRHSITDNSALGHDVGSGIAFTTPMVNYNSSEDPVRLYLNGEELPADIYDYDNKVYLEDGTTVPQSGYLQPYGATLILYPGTKGAEIPMGETVTYSIRNAKIEALQGFVLSLDIELRKYEPSAGRQRWQVTYNTLSTQTPVWEPELLQNTPKSGLAKGSERWPLAGNWISDYDANGQLKPLDEIRPLRSTPADTAYKPEISLGNASAEGFTVTFSAPVNPHDFAIAVNAAAGYSYTWNEDGTELTVAYEAPVAAGTQVTAFIFRSVDLEGNMIGGPVKLDILAE